MVGAVMSCPPRACPWFVGWPRVQDDGCGLVENFCRALEEAAQHAHEGWVVMAQDDVEPAPGLEDELPRLLSNAPCPVVSGFSMSRVRDPRTLAQGKRWRRRRRGELLYVLLLAVRADLVPSMVAGVRAGAGPHDDERLSQWLDAEGVAACTALPNWVQHRGRQSLTGKGWTIGGHPRVSPTFVEGQHAVAL